MLLLFPVNSFPCMGPQTERFQWVGVVNDLAQSVDTETGCTGLHS